VQYKLPFHLLTTGAAEGPARLAAFGGAMAAPFFRVTIPDIQHRRFAAWEANIAGSGGIARYAAARFRSWGAMAFHQAAGSVHSDSAWISPAALGASRIWTYDDPAAATHMRHSEPEPIRGEGIGDVGSLLEEGAREGGIDAIRTHLSQLAQVARKEAPGPDLVPAIRSGFPEADDDALSVASDVATVRRGAATVGATWALLIRWLGDSTERRASAPFSPTSLRQALSRAQDTLEGD
jgi:hypothetical protein